MLPAVRLPSSQTAAAVAATAVACCAVAAVVAMATGSGGGGAFQRHRFRSSWAAAAYHQLQFEQQHKADTQHAGWYSLSDAGSLPKELADTFVQLHQDEETNEFLENCYSKAEHLLTQLYHRVAKSVLSLFVSVTSANGLLRRGSMFVLSGPQFLQLMGRQRQQQQQQQDEALWDSLLDLGAGDGHVTSKYSRYFRRVFATEMATVMRWRLAERGFTLLDADAWARPIGDGDRDDGRFDVIGCVNLLDRCEQPLRLLADARRSLRPGTGRLLLAVVLPLSQFCEFSRDNRPAQRLLVAGATFEEQVADFVQAVLLPQGWRVEAWARAPYLCEGDLYQSFYHLDDAVFVLRPDD